MDGEAFVQNRPKEDSLFVPDRGKADTKLKPLSALNKQYWESEIGISTTREQRTTILGIDQSTFH